MTSASAFEQVIAYHNRTKHSLERYAAGPETLDWTSQPNPFREFDGASKLPLPFTNGSLTTTYADLFRPSAIPQQALDLNSIGILFELSLAISAWKEYGPDRWALRCNPSSGNLHPTEGYLLCTGVYGLDDGVYHYLSRDHFLEQRFSPATTNRQKKARAYIGLSSIHWREAWKYGERAFRYCQHDVGHAIAALRYAAAVLGWELRIVQGLSSGCIAEWLGLNRDQDFLGAETEEPEILLEICTNPALSQLPDWDWAQGEWYGKANTLDPYPMYHWPVIDGVAAATRYPDDVWIASQNLSTYPSIKVDYNLPAASIIRQRRSAQQFDGKTAITAETFFHILDSLLPRPVPPWDIWPSPPRLHPLLFVHRVKGLAPGLYCLPRSTAAESQLKIALSHEFTWQKPAACPQHLPLFQLIVTDCSQAARTISCHQHIASHGCFALGMLAEFKDTLKDAPWRYRELFWEAGIIGQVLYLEAESAGIRGTGIGCYFDDVMHQVIGLNGNAWQSLYHFTVGHPLQDKRITTLPPYPQRN